MTQRGAGKRRGEDKHTDRQHHIGKASVILGSDTSRAWPKAGRCFTRPAESVNLLLVRIGTGGRDGGWSRAARDAADRFR